MGFCGAMPMTGLALAEVLTTGAAALLGRTAAAGAATTGAGAGCVTVCVLAAGAVAAGFDARLTGI